MEGNSSHERTSVNIFDRIDLICAEFRRQIGEEASPEIESFLNEVEGAATQNLFRNLLHIDIEARRRRGERPRSSDYVDRFTQHAQIVRQVFFESTMSSVTKDINLLQWEETQDVDGPIKATLHPVPPAANRLGEYLLVRELGRGGFGIVYEAIHTQHGNRVALKTLPTELGKTHDSPEAAERLHRFRLEFRRMADISHPNLVGMQTLEVDGSQWFFTMDFVQGVDFLSYVRPDGKLDEVRLRATLPQLVSGVVALHGQHIVHRDLKPANVLIDKEGHTVILDFGLVAELRDQSDQNTFLGFAGTPAYAAPEQFSEHLTAAGDWYALGAMLFHALSGELPFSGSWAEVLEKKRSQNAPSLVGREGVPDDLAKLTSDLLARDPLQRPDALTLSKAVSGGDSQLPAKRHEGQLLVGRTDQLAALEQARQRLIRRQSANTVFIRGRSGEGKTTLAEHFLAPLRQSQSLAVLSGRCYDRESVPLKALDSLIDDLCELLQNNKDKAAGWIPDDIRMLAQLFPVLRREPSISQAVGNSKVQLDMKQVRQRAIRALREMLIRIGRDTPVVLFIDDLQWGDSDSAVAIFDLLRPPEAPNVLFLGTFRSDEAADSDFVAKWLWLEETAGETHESIPVAPLSQDECIELVVKLTERNTESIRRRAVELFQTTGGNPFFLNELIDCFDPDTDSFRPIPLHEVIDQKLRQLPTEAESLLHMVAISGQAVSIAEASEAAGVAESALSTLTHMRTARLVRLTGGQEQHQVDTYHDRIRETVLARLPQERRRWLHLQMADLIERHEDSSGERLLEEISRGEAIDNIPLRVYDLAYHFDAAGNEPKGLAYAILAAEEAMSQHALQLAEGYFQTAQKYSNNANSRIKYRISAGIGETLVLMGKYDQASQYLNEALTLTENELEKANVELLQGNIAYHSRPLSESIAIYERALRRAGNYVPRTRIGFRLAYYWETFKRNLSRWLPQSWRASSKSPDEGTLLSIKLFPLAGLVATFHDAHRMKWFMISGFNLLNQFPDSNTHSIGYATYASGEIAFGEPPKQYLQHYQTAYDRAVAADDVAAQAFALRHQGFGWWRDGKYAESIGCLRKAEELFESRAENKWQLVYTRFWLGCVHYREGNLAEAARNARQAFEVAFQHEQHRLAQSAIEPWARAVRGRLPFDELRNSFQPVPDDFTSSAQVLIAEAYWRLRNEEFGEAVAAAENAVAIIDGDFRVNAFTSCAFSTLARCLRLQAINEANPRTRTTLLDRALQAARRAEQVAKRFASEMPEALREVGMTLAEKGEIKRAFNLVQQSAKVAKGQSARFEYAQSLLASGEIGLKLEYPGAKDLVNQGAAEMQKFESMAQEAQ